MGMKWWLGEPNIIGPLQVCLNHLADVKDPDVVRAVATLRAYFQLEQVLKLDGTE
jgi:hypothetical protein